MDIVKSDAISFFYQKVLNYLNDFQKFLSLMTTVNPNNGNKTKKFSWIIFKSDIIFQCSQNTKIFQ